MRVKIKPVNDMAVSDEHLNIIILKKPKRRYRQIIKAYYRRMQKNAEEGSERIVKAITVWQPWATLLATGQKHNETRSWKTSYRGEILIHAAKTDHSGILLHIPMEELKHFQDAGVVNKLPTGAIIGKANLVDCFQIDEAYRRKLQRENPAELAFGDYTIGRYAWVMADAILFNKPIPAKGKQGLWNWEGGIQDGQ